MNIVGIVKKADAIHSLTPNANWTLTDGVLEWMDENQTEPTALEIENELNRLQSLEPLRLLRIERNAKLAETDWVVTMHKELGTNIPAAMKTYRQALRDITDSATSLDDVTWSEISLLLLFKQTQSLMPLVVILQQETVSLLILIQ